MVAYMLKFGAKIGEKKLTELSDEKNVPYLPFYLPDGKKEEYSKFRLAQ